MDYASMESGFTAGADNHLCTAGRIAAITTHALKRSIPEYRDETDTGGMRNAFCIKFWKVLGWGLC